MSLQPSALALATLALASAGLLLYAASWGAVILARWDLARGSAAQLRLERRTGLVSLLAAWVLALELGSLFLFVHAADALAPLFPGAMCAAGTLDAAPWGYAALGVKLVVAVAAGVWLALDHADRQAWDFPLLRARYASLLPLAALVCAGAILQFAFFAGLRPAVITSCCSSIFRDGGEGLGATLAAFRGAPAAAAFWVVVPAAAVAAALFRWTGRGAAAVGLLSAAAVPVSLAAVIGWVSPYVYELPTHHCPFCLLKREYGLVGYPLYAALLLGGISGIAVAALAPFRGVPSLSGPLPPFLRRLATVAIGSFAALLAIVAIELAASRLRP